MVAPAGLPQDHGWGPWSVAEALVLWELCQRHHALLRQFGIEAGSIPRPLPLAPTSRAAPASATVGVRYTSARDALWVEGVLAPEQMEPFQAMAPAAWWDRSERRWTVPFFQADALAPFLDLPHWQVEEEVRPMVAAAQRQAAADIAASYALVPTREIVIPGLNPSRSLYDFQLAGVEYMTNKRRCFNCDPPGVAGKSVQALASVAVLGVWPAIVICKAKLRLNWSKEVQRWFPGRTVAVMEGEASGSVTGHDVVVCNFDIAQYRLGDLLAVGAGGLIVDESQYVKGAPVSDARMERHLAGMEAYQWAMREYLQVVASLAPGESRPKKPRRPALKQFEGSQRTWAVRKLSTSIPEDGAVYNLTSTPRPNRNAELWPQIEILGMARVMGGWGRWGKRYCDRRTEHGREVAEKSTNKDELRLRLRREGMVARKTSALAPQLPPLVPLPIEMELDPALWKLYQQAEADVIEYLAAQQAEIAAESGGDPRKAAAAVRRRLAEAKEIVTLTTLRQMAAEAKLASVIDWLRTFVEENPTNDEGRQTKFIVFAHHQKIQAALAEALGGLWIKSSDQGQTVVEVENVKDRFQSDPEARFIVIGSGAQEGHTLTAGTDACIAELPFTWAAVLQVAGRCYGRLSDAHGAGLWLMVSDRTTDRRIFALIERKGADEEAVVHGSGPAPAAPEDDLTVEGQLLLQFAGIVPEVAGA